MQKDATASTTGRKAELSKAARTIIKSPTPTTRHTLTSANASIISTTSSALLLQLQKSVQTHTVTLASRHLHIFNQQVKRRTTTMHLGSILAWWPSRRCAKMMTLHVENTAAAVSVWVGRSLASKGILQIILHNWSFTNTAPVSNTPFLTSIDLADPSLPTGCGNGGEIWNPTEESDDHDKGGYYGGIPVNGGPCDVQTNS